MPPNAHRNHAPERRSSTANGDHRNSITAPPLQRDYTYYPHPLLVLAVVLVIVLAVKPKKPQFDLQQVVVQYMGISTSNTSSFDGTATATAVSTTPTTASLSLTIRMIFTAVNPNKVGIKYGESRFTVTYRGIPLGKASVPGFYQEAHSAKTVDATIAVDRANLMQADAADLIRDASLNDRVELRVLGDVGAKIRVMDFDSPGVQEHDGVVAVVVA
ncbi:trichohyalin-like [Hibiscus syriacus]|uniref:Trichohyalin-like n=1 Tax=Hibiscus syriacus TaxID=106335 RepID=A0A6A2X0Y6_HIBSY|nr:trichohyalin-like [Hibiscus syriacus]